MAEAKSKSAAAKAATDSKKAPAAKKPAAKAKPAVKKTASRPAAKAAAPARKPASTKTTAQAKKPAGSKKWSPGPEERYNMVQVAAYYIAERSSFSGNPLEFWTAAEAQVSKMLAGK